MSASNPNQQPVIAPLQLAFGQSFRTPLKPAEAAAKHWQEVYRLTKKLRHRPKKRGVRAGAHKRVQTQKQQQLIPQHPELPEFEFTKPATNELAAMKVPDKRQYRFADLGLNESESNQDRFSEAIHGADSSRAGRAICRHLIAALRIQHAEEQNQQTQIQQSQIRAQ